MYTHRLTAGILHHTVYVSGFACIVLGVGVCQTLGAEDEGTARAIAGAKPGIDETRIEHLVRELSSAAYPRRKAATEQLIRIGEPARAALQQAARAPDLELRSAAKRILAIVSKRSFEDAILAFQRDVDGQSGTTLPGWQLASERLGKHAEARALFARLYRAEPVVFSAYEESPEASSEILVQRVRKHLRSVQTRSSWRLRTTPTRRTNSLALLFVGADPRLSVDPRTISEFNNLMNYVWPLQQMQSMSDGARLKRWLGEWILHRSPTQQLTYTNMRIGMSYHIPQTVKLAERILNNERSNQTYKFEAVLCVGRFGKRAHLPLLESLLDDDHVVHPGTSRGRARVVPTELRDVALACLVHLTGQKLSLYNLRLTKRNPTTLFQRHTIAFESAEARAAAIARWRRWKQENGGPRPLPQNGAPPQP